MDIATNLVALATLKAALGGLLANNGVTPPAYFPDYMAAITNAGTFYNRQVTVTNDAARITARNMRKGRWVLAHKIVLPNATEIPADCFKGLEVETLIAPNVTNVGARAFKDCYSLERIELSPNLATIGDDAFWRCKNCDFDGLDFGRVQSVGANAFRHSGIRHTFASHTNRTIRVGQYAFRHSMLEDNFFPNNADGKKGAYSYSRLSGSVGSFDTYGGMDGPFGYAGTGITDYIGFCNQSECLNCTNLQTAFLCSSDIGRDAFKGCVSLRTVWNTDEVDWIGHGAFQGCVALESLSFAVWDGRNPENYGERYTEGVFLGCTNLVSLSVPRVEIVGPWFMPASFARMAEYQGMEAYRRKADGTLITFPVLSRLTQLTLPSVLEIKPYAFGISPTEPLTGIVDLYLPNKTVAQVKGMTGYGLWNLSTNCTIHAGDGSFRYREE